MLKFISDIDQLTQNINNIHDSIRNTLRVVRVSVERLLIVSNSWKWTKIIGQIKLSRKFFD